MLRPVRSGHRHQGGIGGINMGEWVKVLYGLVASLLFGFAVGWLVCKAVT